MTNISLSTIQELNKLIQNVTEERNQYNEYKILFEVIFDCTKSTSKLNSDLRTKIHNILVASDVQQCLDLNLKGTSLLGVDVSNQNDLTYEETEALKASVQNALILKSCKLAKDLDELGVGTTTKQLETRLALDLSPEEKALLELKRLLNEKQALYINKLGELLAIYEDIVKLRTETLPELANKVAADCEIQMNVHRLKSEMLHTKTRIDIFTEEKESMEYYKLLLKNVVQQQEECKSEIEGLKVLKEKYKQVSCKQYDEILQSYLKYKCGVDVKRNFVNPLNMK